MSKTVVLNPGNGDLYNGFLRVTAQIWVSGHQHPEKFLASLPPAPDLIKLYKNWQFLYQQLCNRQLLRSCVLIEDDELEIEESGITSVSTVDFDELSQQLQTSINAWMQSPEFFNISRQLRSQLDPSEEIRVILETNDDILRRLPWHRLGFYQDYPKAEISLSQPEYKRRDSLEFNQFKRNKVRILAILGNCQGIDVKTEMLFLNTLKDAEVVFLVNPTRQELNTQLWDTNGWDILFFAGHSQSEGSTGRIYINDNKTNNSLTIEQLEEALKAAIEKGLKLAIFNSCDGLGLALSLEKLNIPIVIAMREPIPNQVAQEFFKNFLIGFAKQRLPLYLAVQQARRKLQGLEDEFPAASWLPVICINPAVQPPTWLELGGIPPCPYRGLFAFKEKDAQFFFGRESFTQDLVAAVKNKSLVAVVGASGSGKSSVVFAGLIPKLRQKIDVKTIFFRPGNNPLEALTSALEKAIPKNATCFSQNSQSKDLNQIIQQIISENPDTRILIIADQFEELYTLCPEEQRQIFLDALLNICRYSPKLTLVLTLRADFYGYALSYRPLSDALQGAVYNLGAMNSEELRSCIEKPAAQMQVQLDAGLANKLIEEVGKQPGRLPLLEFALSSLWVKQRNGLLTNQAYEEIGGVDEALANYAEKIYTHLCEVDQRRAQQIFMQLVRLGEDTEATRRLAIRHEVKEENWDLVKRLADARIVVTSRNDSTGKETVEIVHEALIRSWRRLQSWLQQDGEFRNWQEHLRGTMRQWEISGKDEGSLLRGVMLDIAQEWHTKRADELSISEKAFIQISLKLRDHKLKKERCRRQLTVSGLLTGIVLALSLAGFGFRASHKARINEISTYRISAEKLLASNQEFDALIASIKAGKLIKQTSGVDSNTQNQVMQTLQQSINFVREQNRLKGHKDVVTTLSFSPDNRLIATGSWDNTVKIWSREGKQLQTLKGHDNGITSVSFSPDGNTIATASYDKTVKLWNREGELVGGVGLGSVKLGNPKGEQLLTLKGHSAGVTSVSFSPDGKLIATASYDKTVKIWNREGKLLQTIKGHAGGINSVSFSPDGKLIATASWDRTARLWNLDGKQLQIFKGHKDVVNGVSFSPNGRLISTASSDHTAKLWNLQGKELHTLKGHEDVVAIANFSPDNKVIATASSDKTVKLWSFEGKELQTLDGHDDRVWSVGFSSDNQTIATASYDSIVRLWSRNDRRVKAFKAHEQGVLSVAFNPKGTMLATASGDKTVKLWNPDGENFLTLKGFKNVVMNAVFNPQGTTIATSSWDNTVKLWSLEGKELATLKGHDAGINSIAYSPKGDLIVTGSSDHKIKFWNHQGKELQTLIGHKDGVNSVSFSPDGNLIASASWDKTVKIWNRDGKLIKTLEGHKGGVNSVTFNPDGKLIATASWDKTVKIWHRDGELIKTLEGHQGGVNSVSFCGDGKVIATASNDKTIKLWSIEGEELQTLKGHHDWVWSVKFTPDGKTIVSVSQDKTMILWNLLPEDRVLNMDRLLKIGCNWTHNYLKNNPDVTKSDSKACDGLI